MGKSKPKIEVTEYRMSVHFGICTGPVDYISAIYVGDKEAWSGNVDEQGEFTLTKLDFFGGVKKEGGLDGKVTFLPGEQDQLFPAPLAAKFGLVPETMPAYRGMATIFFSESDGAARNGFYWTANSPYLRGVWIKVARTSVGLNDDYARIVRGTEFDSNPAHMIYECQRNRSWGSGLAAAAMDTASYEAAAVTLFNEGFGLSMLWARQTDVEAFVKEILDHIEATAFTHPRTGLMTLKLIRDDYDIEELPVFTPDNSKILNFKRKLYGETINEIVVTWTNPENEQEETITVQDDANIAIQGTIVSDGRNYYGIRSADLATTVGYRDLRAASTPLASCDIEMDRSAWDLVPGDVCKITSPEDGISELVMRVGPIDYGKPGQSTIKAALAEDVFSLGTAEYSTPPVTDWEDPAEDPAPAAFTYIFTLPYYLVVNEVDPSVSTGAEYPTVFAGVLAAQTGADTSSFELWGELTDASGGSYEDSLGTKTIVSHGVLATALVEEGSTLIASFNERTQGANPIVGGLLVIGDGDETEVELALITAIDVSGYAVNRGVLDTTPKNWPIDTPVWFVVPDHTFADDEPRSEAELVEYQVLTRTSLGLLAVADAPVESATLTGRPHLPSRPANVQIEGVGFGEADMQAVDPMTVSWSERNRLTEDSVILSWTAATVTPEAGQTNRITVTDLLGNVLTVHDAISGTTYELPHASFDGHPFAYVKVESVRDELVSLQGHAILVKVAPITADTDFYTADIDSLTADNG